MLREIKFRGKREDNGEWIVGSYIYAFDMVHEHCIRCGTTYAVIPETVGQYTGLHDKNGVEIYEGDVVQFHLMGREHIVVYDPAIFRLADTNGDFTTSGYPDWDMCEVIGNIHDKPEYDPLLGQSESED